MSQFLVTTELEEVNLYEIWDIFIDFSREIHVLCSHDYEMRHLKVNSPPPRCPLFSQKYPLKITRFTKVGFTTFFLDKFFLDNSK